jgi:hypothetical protein
MGLARAVALASTLPDGGALRGRAWFQAGVRLAIPDGFVLDNALTPVARRSRCSRSAETRYSVRVKEAWGVASETAALSLT